MVALVEWVVEITTAGVSHSPLSISCLHSSASIVIESASTAASSWTWAGTGTKPKSNTRGFSWTQGDLAALARAGLKYVVGTGVVTALRRLLVAPFASMVDASQSDSAASACSKLSDLGTQTTPAGTAKQETKTL